MQIFGRAGRPQFDTSGEAILITSHDALARYLDKLVRDVPIESSFIKQLADHLNAEIVAGTVTNVPEGIEWLRYTYLFVRMNRNPLAYGITADMKIDDPSLSIRTSELIKSAAILLDNYRMIRYDPASGNFAVTDLGRIASHFYLRIETVATFKDMLEESDTKLFSVADLIQLVCRAHEFANLRVRPEEMDEMDQLGKDDCPFRVKAPKEDFSGKCCVLLQAYVSKAKVDSFTLISDSNYVMSNAGRIARALFEMCLKKGKADTAIKLVRIAKSIDKRLWWFESPLRQFESEIPEKVHIALENWMESSWRCSNIDSRAFDAILALLDMQADEVGQLCHWFKGGEKVKDLVRLLPRIDINCVVQPITRGILRFQVVLKPCWKWTMKWHGSVQTFWLWVEDTDQNVM
jgi:activating signal cointegrator complex subunit 3